MINGRAAGAGAARIAGGIKDSSIPRISDRNGARRIYRGWRAGGAERL